VVFDCSCCISCSNCGLLRGETERERFFAGSNVHFLHIALFTFVSEPTSRRAQTLGELARLRPALDLRDRLDQSEVGVRPDIGRVIDQ